MNNSWMTVGELKEDLKDVADDVIVCGVGHHEEPLEIFGSELRCLDGGDTQQFVIIMEAAGPPQE